MQRAAPYRLGQILDRMSSADKDLRYMAISDLINEMEKGDIKLDEDGEIKVVRKLLTLLSDKNSEVQNMVIKCLGFLTPLLEIQQINHLVASLHMILVKETQPNEVCSTALKTVVTQLNPLKSGHAVNVAKEALPKVLDLAGSKFDSHVLEALDVTGDLLQRFGPQLTSYHAQAHDVLSKLMRSQKGLIRKKATQAIGNLATSCSADLFNETLKNLLEWISKSSADSPITRSYINGLSFLAKGNGSYLSKNIAQILPVLKTVLDNTDEDETREAIVQTYDILYSRCPQEMANYRSEIQKLLLNYIAYDPNYEYGDDGDDIDMDGSQYDDDSDNQYSDTDDDISWKVRRACAKALQTQVKQLRTPTCLNLALTEIAPVVVERFKERDQHVLVEVIATFTTIAHRIKIFVPTLTNETVVQGDLQSSDDVVVGCSHFAASLFTEEQTTVLAKFNFILPSLLRGMNKLKDRVQSLARTSFFELLTELTKTFPNILAGQQELVFATMQAGVKDTQAGAQNKLIALNFFSTVMQRHDPLEFKHKLKQWQDVLMIALNEHFFRVVSEALVVLGGFADVIQACRPHVADADAIAAALFECLYEKLKGAKLDLEVLERTILCVGQMFAKLGGDKSDTTNGLIEKLVGILEKPTCESTTTLATIRALTEIAKSSNQMLLKEKSSEIIKQLALLISRGNRVLKVAALELCLIMLKTGMMTGDIDSIRELVSILPKQIVESDLQVTQIALKCLTAAIAEGVYNKDETLTALVNIFQSHLLQGATLDAAVSTVRSLASELMKQDPGQFKEFLNQLTGPVYGNHALHKQVYKSISIAVAEVAAASNDIDQVGNLVEQLKVQMTLPASQDYLRLFCIYAIGELGRRFHSVFENSRFKPEVDLINAFSMPQEDLRIAAAQSLGALAVGGFSKYLPVILERIASSPDYQYLLLHSLKEIIASKQFANDVYGSLDQIWPVLVSHADCAEEGVRTIVAECIGRICFASPSTLLPKLKELLSSHSTNVRYCAISSFKYIISGSQKSMDDILADYLPAFLNTVTDNDMRVRRIALVVFNAAVHNKTALVREHMSSLIPIIYEDCKVKKELIREVEMGPFKHQVDDGIDVRKAAYECMFTILETCIEQLDIFEFIDKMEDGIKDSNHDIRLLTFMMLIRLSIVCPAQVLSKFDRVSENLRVHLSTKPKANAVKQEVEKLEELKRGVIRVVRAMQKIPDAERHPQLVEILNFISYSPELTTLCEQVDKDNKGDAEITE